MDIKQLKKWQIIKNETMPLHLHQEIIYYLKVYQKIKKNLYHLLSTTKVSNGAKIRNRYNQVPHLTQDTKWESDKLTEDTTNESQEVSPFPAGDHKAHINRRAQNIANTRQNKNIKDPQKKYRLGTVSKIFYWRA